MINPEWLRYFQVTAETRSLRLAAERLHITHQALSQAIARLEAHYGQTLLERGRRVRGLTPAGELLLEQSRGIIDGFETLERRMKEFRSEIPSGPVRIAGAGVIHNYLLPPILAKLLERFPEIRPQLFSMRPDEVERWVALGEVDVGLLATPPLRRDVAWSPGLASPYVIVGRPHPKVAWDQLSYVTPRLFDGTGGQAMDGWPEERFPRRVVAEVDQLEAALSLCEAGLGAAFVPHLAIAARLERGLLAVVADAPFPFTEQFYAIWRRDVRLTPAARETLRAMGARDEGARPARGREQTGEREGGVPEAEG